MELWISIFERIIYMSIQATVAVLAVILVRLLFQWLKVPKKYAYMLWIIPFIRLVCPFAFDSNMSIMPEQIIYEREVIEVVESTDSYREELVESDTDSNEEDISEIVQEKYESNEEIVVDTNHSEAAKQESQEQLQSVVDSQASLELPESPEQPVPQEPAEKSVNTLFIVSVLWASGVVAIFIHSIVSLIIFKKRLVGSIKLSENIFSSDFVDTAFVMGFVRPRIYVPSNIRERDMEYVLTHERMHISRLDYLFKPLAYFVVAIHWFNPIAWVAYMSMERDMEMSCDEAVLTKLGLDNKKQYAKALLQLSTGKRFIPDIPATFSEGDTKGRVKNIMRIKRPVVVVVILAVVVIVTLGLVLLTNPKKEGESSTDSEIIVEENVSYELACGTYYMVVDDAERGPGNIFKYVPFVTINEDGTIAFTYDPSNSYYPYAYGEYSVEDNRLSFTTKHGKTFNFQILDSGKLAFISENSYGMEEADGEIVHLVEDKSVFVRTEEETDDVLKDDYLFYTNIGEVSYNQASVTEDMPLGADGVILDYVDADRVIFHGYAGLFVYDRNSFELIAQIDLKSIDASYTQGDEAYTVEVSPDGEYVYLFPVEEGWFSSFSSYSYTYTTSDFAIGSELPAGAIYDDPWGYSYEVATGDMVKCPPVLLEELDYFNGKLESYKYVPHIDYAMGFYSNDCVKTSEGEYGYLYCSTGLWKDICYVESDMIYAIYGENYTYSDLYNDVIEDLEESIDEAETELESR